MVTLSQLLCRLCDAALDFVIVGGFAEIAYTRVPVTRKLEICAALNQDDVAKLRDASFDLNPRHRKASPQTSFLDGSSADVELQNLYLETDAGALDVLSSIPGVGGFHRVRSRAIEFTPFGRRCRVMSLDDLIRAREALGRETDIVMLNELRAIRRERRAVPR
jgi:hypothetical protein